MGDPSQPICDCGVGNPSIQKQVNPLTQYWRDLIQQRQLKTCVPEARIKDSEG